VLTYTGSLWLVYSSKKYACVTNNTLSAFVVSGLFLERDVIWVLRARTKFNVKFKVIL